MSRGVLSRGTRAGAMLAAFAVALAFVGLSPSFSWVPEIPLLAVATLVPLSVFATTGFRAGRQSGRVVDGLAAGAVAGAISGAVGGLSYVYFGKPALNIVVGLALGTIGGGVVGALGGRFGIER